MSGAATLRAPDGRPLALVVRADFDEFAAHPPTFETDEERRWLAEHYEGHSIRTVEDGSRLLEIKQGPAPANPFHDNVPVPGQEERA